MSQMMFFKLLRAFSLFDSAFCLFSRSLSPHIMQFAYPEQNAECNGMTQKQENEAICIYHFHLFSNKQLKAVIKETWAFKIIKNNVWFLKLFLLCIILRNYVEKKKLRTFIVYVTMSNISNSFTPYKKKTLSLVFIYYWWHAW